MAGRILLYDAKMSMMFVRWYPGTDQGAGPKTLG